MPPIASSATKLAIRRLMRDGVTRTSQLRCMNLQSRLYKPLPHKLLAFGGEGADGFPQPGATLFE